jgi:hydrogenase maturation factor
MPLPLGKLDAEHLAGLLAGIPTAPEVVLGPGIGHDVTVLDLGTDDLLLAKTDPITFATDDIGYYAVAVNSNDLACSGGEPRWFLATLLLPEAATTPELMDCIFAQITAACAAIGVSLVGGHTEVTHGLDRPVLVGQMLGTVPRDRLVRPDGLRPGDAILLTKGFPVEGVALIARERRADLLAQGHEPAFLDRCAAFLREPGLMVLPEARAICGTVRPHALHDPTEGGVATGLWELAQAGGVGLRIAAECLPLLPEAAALCTEFGLDPLGLIASGSLLVGVAPEDAEAALAACGEAGVACTHIGEATAPEEGVVLVRDGVPEPMPRFDQDEVTRLFCADTAGGS